MLEMLGASDVLSIEANTRAYLKCLIAKELLGLHRVRFLCGDFVEYLRNDKNSSFDLCIASGVLYHMQSPAELLALLAAHCREHLFLWTHYYDNAIIGASPGLGAKFSAPRLVAFAGFEHTLYPQEYQSAVEWSGFCGGSAPISYWMSRKEILDGLHFFGFRDLRIGFDQPDHPNGPAMAIIARNGL